MISKLWTFMIIFAVASGILCGRTDAVSAAAIDGTAKAVDFIIGISGTICFWSGLMEVMKQSGLLEKSAVLIRPILRPLFGKRAARDKQTSECLSANITANLLGLGNAATPFGLKAAAGLNKLDGNGKDAPASLITLVVLNTASMQLIPTTVAGIRTALGCATPYDIIVPVWIASAVSVLAGVVSAKIFEKLNMFGRRRHK